MVTSRAGRSADTIAVAGARRAVPRATQGRRAASAHGQRRRPLYSAIRNPQSTIRRALAHGQRGLVVGLAAVVLVAFVAGTVEQRRKEGQLRAQVAARTAALRAAEERHARLTSQLAANDPDGYRARVEDTARRQLNLGYPDETVVLVGWTEPPAGAAAPTPLPAAPAPPAREPNWKAWLRLLAGE